MEVCFHCCFGKIKAKISTGACMNINEDVKFETL